MSTTLTAGGNISLTAGNSLVSDVVAGFGWSVIDSNGPQSEVVPSVILCGSDGRALSRDHFLFFNQLTSPDGAVVYNDTDDEQVEISLRNVPDSVEKMVFIAYINPDTRRGGNFSSVRNLYIKVYDKTGLEIVNFPIATADTAEISAMILGEIYKRNNDWKFRARGEGFSDGLQGVSRAYGINL